MPKKQKSKKPAMDLKYEVETKLQDMGIPDPHLFLCEIMAGHDPRGSIGKLYQLIQEAVESENDLGLPDLQFWVSIKNLIFEDPVLRNDPIPLSDSTSAAKELLMYLFPKLKNVEVSGDMEHLVKVVPLSKAEIDELEKRFNDEF